MRAMGWATALLASLAGLVTVVALTSLGKLTLDTGWGRRVRPLGPRIVRIGAPRETVFDIVAVPYLSANAPRELREKIHILERRGDMAIAVHHTKVGRVVAVTVESVTFVRPDEIAFRLLRGPVPLVIERFRLRDAEGGTATELEWSGVMGTDLWGVGEAWGRLVARYWDRAVAEGLASLRLVAEDAAARAAKRAPRSPSA